MKQAEEKTQMPNTQNIFLFLHKLKVKLGNKINVGCVSFILFFIFIYFTFIILIKFIKYACANGFVFIEFLYKKNSQNFTYAYISVKCEF